MKNIFSCIFILFALSFAISCTKTTPPVTNPNPIEGLWVGTYKITKIGNVDSFYYSFSITDSTVINSGSGAQGTFWGAIGPWTLTKDSLFSTTLTTMDGTQPENVQSISAIYDKNAGTLTGTWVDIVGGTTGSGTFWMKRVK